MDLPLHFRRYFRSGSTQLSRQEINNLGSESEKTIRYEKRIEGCYGAEAKPDHTNLVPEVGFVLVVEHCSRLLSDLLL